MPRIELTANTDFYVSATGNDANDGLTAATPKLTTQAMLGVLQTNYDLRGFTIRLLHTPGAYPAFYLNGRMVGQIEPPRIVGSTTRGACSISGSTCVWLQNTELLVEGFSVSAQVNCFSSEFFSTIWYRDIDFGSCPGGHHIQVQKQGASFYLSVRDDGGKSNYFISGDAYDHLYVNGASVAYLTETVNSNGIQFIGQRTFTMFADAIQTGSIVCHTNAWSGPAPLGAAAYSRWNSAVANAASIPGNQSANYVDPSSFLA